MSRKIPVWQAAAATTLVAVLVGGAVAIGALPDSEGRINACYVKHGKRKGDVRLLVSGTSCRSGEKRIAWNQKGPPGQPGPPGATNVTVRHHPFSCRSQTCTRLSATANCFPGERATGGGVALGLSDNRLAASVPGGESETPTRWEAIVDNDDGQGGISGTIHVVCAAP